MTHMYKTTTGLNCQRHPSLIAGVVMLMLISSTSAVAQTGPQFGDTMTEYIGTSLKVQEVHPRASNRGVRLEGSLIYGPALPLKIDGGQPHHPQSNNDRLNSVRLFGGEYSITDTDLALPAPGFPWIIGRSYNFRQEDDTDYVDSDGYQGWNWFQLSQPELVFAENDTGDADDVVYLVYGADRYIEFKRTGTGSDQFESVNGGAGVFDFDSDANGADTYTYTDPNGLETIFFGFDDSPDLPAAKEGQLWKTSDQAGNVAFVGDESSKSDALSDGYNSDGTMKEAYDTAGRKYVYTYDVITGRLESVHVEELNGTWAETGDRVEYDYYGASDDYGSVGDLRRVTIETPLTDSGQTLTQEKYYRYYGTAGKEHGLQYIFDFEGARRFDWDDDGTFNQSYQTESTIDDLKPYASAYLEYDAERRITKAWFNGECGCGGGVNGTYEFEYELNTEYSDDPDAYDTEWYSRTVTENPDGTYVTQYFDELGQGLHTVTTVSDPDDTPAPDRWVQQVVRDSDGRITEIRTPAANDTYTHAIGVSWGITAKTGAGLIVLFDYDSDGLLTDIRHKTGTSGTAYYDATMGYETLSKTIGNAEIELSLIDYVWQYTIEGTTQASESSGPTGAHKTTLAYTTRSAAPDNMPLSVKEIAVTYPAVSSSNNGSGSSESESIYLRKDGTIAFVEAADGIHTYFQYTDGSLTKVVDDVKTNGSFPSGDDPNTDFGITESSSGSDRTTTNSYDAQGRIDTVTRPDDRVFKRYYSQLLDRRTVALVYNDFDASPLKFYGPVSYVVGNHANQAEVSGLVGLTGNSSTQALTNHVDETTDDPIDAIEDASLGTLVRLYTTIFDETGMRVEARRVYYDISEADYDEVTLTYDEMGRRETITDPTDTILKSDYDELGRLVGQLIGTDDSGGVNDNMVTYATFEYDGGNAGGNGLLTELIEDADGNLATTTDQRTTEFTYDARGQVVVQENPVKPHVFNKYDNLGRRTATGLFTDTTGITVGTDDPVTETTARVGLSQAFFDERGRLWKSQRHKIDESDGSDDDHLIEERWFDSAGRVLKIDGEQFIKMSYDRLGRATHQFVLASTDSTAYAEADDVESDIVIGELQTVYESTDSDDVLMTVQIDRHPDDYGTGETTGPLDTNADSDALIVTSSNLEGRAQIAAYWYDQFGRVTDSVMYGTNGGSTFNRGSVSTPPGRSLTTLRTTYSYGIDGSVEDAEDPRGHTRRYEYDDAGRQITLIQNYVNGVPSGAPTAETSVDDTHTRFKFVDGQLTKTWVDFDGLDPTSPGTDDQVTEYVYGVSQSDSPGASDLDANFLLRKIIYPDLETGELEANRRELFAYNALREVTWNKKQEDSGGNANVLEHEYDLGGRHSATKVTSLDSDFDGAVRRIESTYSDRGHRELVTQYDAVTAGSVVNEVKFSYNDWGLVSNFEQDRNSAVGAIGSVDDYEIDYTYEKATSGRNTIRLKKRGRPGGGDDIEFRYRSTNGLHDDELSRVSRIVTGIITSVSLVDYEYLGLGHTVSMDYLEPEIYSQVTDGTPGSFPGLGRFNQQTTVSWTKDLTTDVDFYDVDLTYDENFNITALQDNIYDDLQGTPKRILDAAYTMDDLDRLTDAEWGHWTGTVIETNTTTRQQVWDDATDGGLDQIGNWVRVKLDLDGDGVFTGTGEYDEHRTHSDANELVGRDTDNNGTDNFTLAYDETGNLIDDGNAYKYTYDPFGRLTEIRNQSDALVAEYVYNGLGHRIGAHYDADADGTVESDPAHDPWFYFVYDVNWRIVAVYRHDDTDPKEEFVYHNDSIGGHGASDRLLLRDKDANTAWRVASDGTLEERIYFCQNWRGDVVSLISDSGARVEEVRYSEYGIPYGIPAGDIDVDGDVDKSGDKAQLNVWINTSTYDVRGDMDLDGDLDSTDVSLLTGNTSSQGGWGVLSSTGSGNRRGYAGYEASFVRDALYSPRNRVLDSELGRFLTRDPLGLQAGPNVYGYVRNRPLTHIDPMGLQDSCIACHGNGGGLGGVPRVKTPPPVLPGGFLYVTCKGPGSGNILDPLMPSTSLPPGHGDLMSALAVPPLPSPQPGGNGFVPRLVGTAKVAGWRLVLIKCAAAAAAAGPVVLPIVGGAVIGAAAAGAYIYREDIWDFFQPGPTWGPDPGGPGVPVQPVPRVMPKHGGDYRKGEMCDFYRDWCIWHARDPEGGPGRGWGRRGQKGVNDCWLCHAMCKSTGKWDFLACPIGGPRGPRWVDPGHPNWPPPSPFRGW